MVVAGRLGAGLDPAQHPPHHREVAELHEHDAQERCERVGPVVDSVDAGPWGVDEAIGSTAIGSTGASVVVGASVVGVVSSGAVSTGAESATVVGARSVVVTESAVSSEEHAVTASSPMSELVAGTDHVVDRKRDQHTMLELSGHHLFIDVP